MYDRYEKYSGRQDEVFAVKLATFFERCGQAGVQDLKGAFSAMLDGAALLYWRTNCQQMADVVTIANTIQAHFETEEYRRNKLNEWSAVRLSTEIRKVENAGKPLTEVFNSMIAHLRTIQPGLSREYQTEHILFTRIIPRITSADAPSLSTIECSKAINAAISEVAKLKATRNLTDALRMRNGPQT